MTDDGDLRAVVLGAVAMLESERDEALARAEAAEACAKESAEIMYRQRDGLEGQRDVALARAKEAERLLSAALARAAEAERLLSEYRRENGCTRGQRTTQWCGEAVRLRVALVAIAEVQPASLVMSAWSEIDRLREIAKAALRAWNADLRELPGFLYDSDDGFDCTYADFHYAVPEMHRQAVADFLKDKRLARRRKQ